MGLLSHRSRVHSPEELQEQLKNEENTKRKYITPIIEERWGKNTDNIVMEYYFTAGRVNINGDKVARGEQKKADNDRASAGRNGNQHTKHKQRGFGG